MNEYVEKAKKILTATSHKVLRKSSKIYSTTKLSLQVSNLKAEIDENYKKIGEIFYASYKGDSASGEEAELICKKIEELKEEIDTISAQISEIKDVDVCKNCGAEVSKDSAYCAKCGEEI